MTRHTGLYNGGRPGKRSGPSMSPVTGIQAEDFSLSTEKKLRAARVVAINARNNADCCLLLDALGIDLKELLHEYDP
jgi:hypothetical protein